MDSENDDRLYAELEAEDEAAGDENLLSDDLSGRDDDGGDRGGVVGPRESKAEPAADSGDAEEREERARIEADSLIYEQQTYGQQRQPRPDPTEDPIGYIRAMDRERQVERSRADYQQFMGKVDEQERVFVALQPDYHQAAEYLEKGRRAELAELYGDDDRQAHIVARQHGFANPKQLREAIFINDAQTIARNALMAGKNPAKVYFDLAKSRGYQPKAGSRSSGGRSSGGRSSGGRSSSGVSTAKLVDLYAENPEEFDRQFDKMARTGALG